MLRFTIRDLLWLTLVVALAVGWWVDRTQLAKQIRPRIKISTPTIGPHGVLKGK